MNQPTVVTQFEAHTLDRSDWNHTAHLSVGAWYVFRGGNFQEALTNFRPRLLAYNQAQGIADRPGGGYNETLTQFWLRQIDAVYQLHSASDFMIFQQSVLEQLADRHLWKVYYSPERLWSEAARTDYLPPDLVSFRTSDGIT